MKPYRGGDTTRHLATLECEIGEDSSRFILQVSGFSSYMSRSGLVLYRLVAPVPTVSGELGKKYVSYSVPNCPISRRLTAYSGGYLVITLLDGHAPGKQPVSGNQSNRMSDILAKLPVNGQSVW